MLRRQQEPLTAHSLWTHCTSNDYDDLRFQLSADVTSMKLTNENALVHGSLASHNVFLSYVTLIQWIVAQSMVFNVPLRLGEWGEHDRLIRTRAALHSSIWGSLEKSSWLLLGLRLRDLQRNINHEMKII